MPAKLAIFQTGKQPKRKYEKRMRQ